MSRRRHSPPPNIDIKKRRALKELRKDTSIVILQADKGNAIVIMDREQYERKMDELLSDPSYRKISGDPTPRIKRSVMTTFLAAEKKGSLPEILWKKLASQPSSTTAPKVHGLPKVHKPDIPLHQILATIGSSTYNLSKELTRIISPLTYGIASSRTLLTSLSRYIRATRSP